MIEQRRGVFDSLLLEVVIPWLISVKCYWALSLIRRLWNRQVESAPALVQPVDGPDVLPGTVAGSATVR